MNVLIHLHVCRAHEAHRNRKTTIRVFRWISSLTMASKQTLGVIWLPIFSPANLWCSLSLPPLQRFNESFSMRLSSFITISVPPLRQYFSVCVNLSARVCSRIPRETCALSCCVMDKDGTCYLFMCGAHLFIWPYSFSHLRLYPKFVYGGSGVPHMYTMQSLPMSCQCAIDH